MVISSIPELEGFRLWSALIQDSYRPMVYLDGVDISLTCVYADDMRGVAICRIPNAADPRGWSLTEVQGYVRIIIPIRAEGKQPLH